MNLTYDSIAEAYHRLAVPMVFLSPAKDILAVLQLEPDSQILDVGAGAGPPHRQSRVSKTSKANWSSSIFHLKCSRLQVQAVVSAK